MQCRDRKYENICAGFASNWKSFLYHRCRDINLVNVWLCENFVLPNVVTAAVVQSEKMSNKLKIILSEEERTRSIYRFSEDTTTFECMKGDIWENPSRDGENVKNATKFNQSQLSKKKTALTHFFAQDEKNNVHILGQVYVYDVLALIHSINRRELKTFDQINGLTFSL